MSDARPAGEVIVELAHEALIHEWPLFRTWVEADRDALLRREAIRRAAHDWEAHDRDPSYLELRGRRLVDVEAFLRQSCLPLNGLERAYVDANLALRAQEEQDREAQRQREQMTDRARAELAESARRFAEQLAHASQQPASPDAAVATAPMPQQPPHKALVELLIRIPVTTDEDGRTMLLQGIPGRDAMRRGGANRRLDLDLIVSQVIEIGTLGSGINPIVILIDNALPYAGEGSATHAELEMLRAAFARNPSPR